MLGRVLRSRAWRGHRKLEELTTSLDWPDAGEIEETAHPMQFWARQLHCNLTVTPADAGGPAFAPWVPKRDSRFGGGDEDKVRRASQLSLGSFTFGLVANGLIPNSG